MKQTIRTKDHSDWLATRSQGIGSSEVGTILGLNPYETPYQLWRRKKGLDAPKQENFAMRAGHYLEDAVSRFFADETGSEIIKRSADEYVVYNTEKPYLRVSPDRTYWIEGLPHKEENKAILECKTTQKTIDADNIPEWWFCQLQYQLGIDERQQGSLAWLTMGRDFGYRTFDFDKDFFAYMVEQVEKFWIDNILGNNEPDPINVEDIITMYPRETAGKSVQATADIVYDLSRLRDVKHELDELTDEKKKIEDKIKEFMGDAESIITPATNEQNPEVIVTWKSSKDSLKFDEKSFKVAQPELWQQYAKTRPGSRRFLVK